MYRYTQENICQYIGVYLIIKLVIYQRYLCDGVRAVNDIFLKELWSGPRVQICMYKDTKDTREEPYNFSQRQRRGLLRERSRRHTCEDSCTDPT